MKRNEVLTQATRQMHLKNILLNEISQTQTVTNYMILFYELPRIDKSVETNYSLVVAKGWKMVENFF